MAVSVVHWMAIVCIAGISLIPESVNSQIPTACVNQDSLSSMTCCPNDCGSDEGRGMCADVEPSPNMTSNNVRSNWPHYFQRVCQCSGNYSGYDCNRCKYGHYGDDCNMNQTLPRRNILKLNDSEWMMYNKILQQAQSYDSGYKVVLEESTPGSTDIMTADVTLYQLFIWLHHFAAKDSECNVTSDNCTKVDYAHEATGFPTWHRQYLLWLEWEIQYMLKSMNHSDYHTFRLNYWDWRDMNRDKIFTASRLGENRDELPVVSGTLFEAGWETICWYGGSGGVTRPQGTICDPRDDTGPLQRCPVVDGTNPCKIQDNWPTTQDVNDAITKPLYDTEPYNISADVDSFRNLLEGFETDISDEDCNNNDLCSDNTQRHLHNTVHIIVGMGDLSMGKQLPSDLRGVMADVAASPNDPLFINHHGMIDCILEEWLRRNPNGRYPDVPTDIKGHQREGYTVPFFPLYKHSEVFMTADNFGYMCEISYPQPNTAALLLSKQVHWIMLIAVCSIALLF